MIKKKSVLVYLILSIIVVNCSTQSSTNVQTRKSFYTPPNWKEPIVKKKSPENLAKKSSQLTNQPGLEDSPKTSVPETNQQILEDRPKSIVPFQREQMDGYASWYGPGFHGKLTANGEKYNQNMMTAAHKLLPMNTIVRVVNLENQGAVTVRINDRGPYKKDRIIDLTKKAADLLGFSKQGTARVSLEVIQFPDDFDPKEGLLPYKQVVIQVAVFKNKKNAVNYIDQLNIKYNQIKFFIDPHKKETFTIVAGPYLKRNKATLFSKKLKAEGINNFVRSFKK